MTKETLLGWGLSEEQAKKVLDGLNSSFVTKVRFDEVNTELTAAKKTIKERDTQLETLKKASGDTKALQDQIIQLQADNKKKDDDHAAELKNLRIGNAVELALTGAVKGLDDEIKKLVKDEKTAFLFEAKETGGKFRGAKSAERGEGGQGGMTLENLKKLPPVERHRWSVEHPEEYKALYEGGNA